MFALNVTREAEGSPPRFQPEGQSGTRRVSGTPVPADLLQTFPGALLTVWLGEGVQRPSQSCGLSLQPGVQRRPTSAHPGPAGSPVAWEAYMTSKCVCASGGVSFSRGPGSSEQTTLRAPVAQTPERMTILQPRLLRAARPRESGAARRGGCNRTPGRPCCSRCRLGAHGQGGGHSPGCHSAAGPLSTFFSTDFPAVSTSLRSRADTSLPSQGDRKGQTMGAAGPPPQAGQATRVRGGGA